MLEKHQDRQLSRRAVEMADSKNVNNNCDANEFKMPDSKNSNSDKMVDSKNGNSDANAGVISRGLRASGACGQNVGHVTFDPRDLSHDNLALSLFSNNFPASPDRRRKSADTAEIGCSVLEQTTHRDSREEQLCDSGYVVWSQTDGEPSLPDKQFTRLSVQHDKDTDVSKDEDCHTIKADSRSTLFVTQSPPRNCAEGVVWQGGLKEQVEDNSTSSEPAHFTDTNSSAEANSKDKFEDSDSTVVSARVTDEKEHSKLKPGPNTDSVSEGVKLCVGLDKEGLLSALSVCLTEKNNTLSFSKPSAIQDSSTAVEKSKSQPQQRSSTARHVLDTVFEREDSDASDGDRGDEIEVNDGDTGMTRKTAPRIDTKAGDSTLDVSKNDTNTGDHQENTGLKSVHLSLHTDRNLDKTSTANSNTQGDSANQLNKPATELQGDGRKLDSEMPDKPDAPRKEMQQDRVDYFQESRTDETPIPFYHKKPISTSVQQQNNEGTENSNSACTRRPTPAPCFTPLMLKPRARLQLARSLDSRERLQFSAKYLDSGKRLQFSERKSYSEEPLPLSERNLDPRERLRTAGALWNPNVSQTAERPSDNSNDCRDAGKILLKSDTSDSSDSTSVFPSSTDTGTSQSDLAASGCSQKQESEPCSDLVSMATDGQQTGLEKCHSGNGILPPITERADGGVTVHAASVSATPSPPSLKVACAFCRSEIVQNVCTCTIKQASESFSVGEFVQTAFTDKNNDQGCEKTAKSSFSSSAVDCDSKEIISPARTQAGDRRTEHCRPLTTVTYGISATTGNAFGSDPARSRSLWSVIKKQVGAKKDSQNTTGKDQVKSVSKLNGPLGISQERGTGEGSTEKSESLSGQQAENITRKQRKIGVASTQHSPVSQHRKMSWKKEDSSRLSGTKMTASKPGQPTSKLSQPVVKSKVGYKSALSETRDKATKQPDAASYDVSMDDDSIRVHINKPGGPVAQGHQEQAGAKLTDTAKGRRSAPRPPNLQCSSPLAISEACGGKENNCTAGYFEGMSPELVPSDSPGDRPLTKGENSVGGMSFTKQDRSYSDPQSSMPELSLTPPPVELEQFVLRRKTWQRSAVDVRKPQTEGKRMSYSLHSSQSDFCISPSRKASLAVAINSQQERTRRNSVSILPSMHDKAQGSGGAQSQNTERVVLAPRRKVSSKEQLSKILNSTPQSPSLASAIAASLEFFTCAHLTTTLASEDLKTTSVARGEVQVTLPVCHVTKNGNTVSMTTVEAIQQTLLLQHPNLQVLLESAPMTDSTASLDEGGTTEDGTAAVPAVSQLPANAELSPAADRTNGPISPSALEDASDEMADLQAASAYTFGSRRRSSSQGRVIPTGSREDVRRSSINTCIRSMREQTSNYASQLIGVQIVGHYANEETLKVVLAKSDAISCVISAMKEFPERLELQCQACASLLKMASASEANCVHICKNDGVATIANTMRRYDDNIDVTRLALSILGYMSTADCVTDELIRHCCHRDVLAAMSRHSHDLIIVRQCCFVLGNLITSVEVAEQLMLIGGVHTIISMIKHYQEDKDILENGCRALGSFAVYDETCLDVAQAGATETVLEAMKSKSAHSDESVKESGCWALACLTCTATTCEEVVALGGLNVLLDTLEAFPKEELLQDYGVRALCNLGAQEATLQHVSTARVVNVLLSVCRNFPESVQTLEIVMIALGEVSATEPEVHRCLLSEGGVQTVVTVMKYFQENRTIQENGCRILGNMAVHEHFRKATEQQGASQAVISAMLNMEMYPDIQLYGCMALMNLTADLMDNKMRVKNNGAVPTLLCTIRQFPDNPEVVLSALKTLGNLVDLEESCRQLLDERGLATVVNIAKDNKADDSIRSFAALVLSGLTALTDLPEVDLLLVERTLVSLQAALPDDPDMALTMCQGLHNLVKTESGLSILMKEGWLDVIESTMAHFPKELDIHLTSCRMIASVAMESGKRAKQKSSCPLSENTVKTVLQSMREFPDAKELQMVGCGALSCICENFDKFRGIIVREGGVRDVTKAMTRFPTDDRLHAVGHIALAYLLPIDCSEHAEDAEAILTVVGKSMSQFVENEELQISGCSALERCDIRSVDDVFEALTHVWNAMRRHGDSDKVLQAAAKVFKRFGGDDRNSLVGQVISTPTPIRKVFWTTLQE